MKNIYFTLSIIFCSSYLQSNPLNGFSVGVGPSIGIVSGVTFTSIPVGATVVLTTPYGFKLGPIDYAVSLAFGGYSGKYQSVKWVDEYNPSLIGFGGNLLVARFITAEFHAGILGQGFGYRGFSGLSLERFTKNLPINLLVGSELFYSTDMAGAGNPSGWMSITARVDYPIGGKVNRKSNGSGPSASVDGADGRPADCGSAEIDNFKNAAFDLNDKIVELKEKLKGVSDGLAESNDVLAAIAAHSEGPLGWSRQQIAIAILKATQGPTFNVETNPVVEKVLTAFKEAEGSLQEKIIIAIAKASEESDALVAIDMDKFITLKINYDPTKMIREKLGTLKSGVVDGAEELKSVPDDLKAIGGQAQSLLASAGELPKAAKSLGFSKAPAALKSIKATTGVLKNIPNEVTAIGDESKKVMEEIGKV